MGRKDLLLTRGFTLVELLIVVAIISALATLGVPSYRRMVQRSKQANAKTLLAGVYSAEAGFHAEHQFYANHLSRIGFDTKSSKGEHYYFAGFPGADCTCNQGTLRPEIGSNDGKVLVQKFPQYYVVDDPYGCGIGQTLLRVCEPSNVAPEPYLSYVAGATGVIAPKIDRETPNLLDTDYWTMNNERTLRHERDGVR